MATPIQLNNPAYVDGSTLTGDGSLRNPVRALFGGGGGGVTGNPLIINPPVVPAVLPAIPAITLFDPGTIDTVVEVRCDVNGSIIGGMVPGVVSGGGTPAQAHGEIRVLRNLTPATSIDQGNLVILQDQVGGQYTFHLSSRRPSLTVPVLGTLVVQFDATQEKWFVLGNNTEQSAAYPRRCIPAVLAAGNVNNWDPVDATSAMPYWALNHIVAQGNAGGTVLTGLKQFAPAGSDGGLRVLLSNYGTAMDVAHLSVLSASGNQFLCPGGLPFTLRQFASVWLNKDEGNHAWLLEAV